MKQLKIACIYKQPNWYFAGHCFAVHSNTSINNHIECSAFVFLWWKFFREIVRMGCFEFILNKVKPTTRTSTITNNDTFVSLRLAHLLEIVESIVINCNNLKLCFEKLLSRESVIGLEISEESWHTFLNQLSWNEFFIQKCNSNSKLGTISEFIHYYMEWWWWWCVCWLIETLVKPFEVNIFMIYWTSQLHNKFETYISLELKW